MSAQLHQLGLGGFDEVDTLIESSSGVQRSRPLPGGLYQLIGGVGNDLLKTLAAADEVQFSKLHSVSSSSSCSAQEEDTHSGRSQSDAANAETGESDAKMDEQDDLDDDQPLPDFGGAISDSDDEN